MESFKYPIQRLSHTNQMHSRRDFLWASGGVAVLALVPSAMASPRPGLAVQTPGGRASRLRLVSLYDVNYHTFAGLRNPAFTVSPTDGTPGSLTLLLHKVERSRFTQADARPSDGAFSLVFTGSAARPLRQGIHRFVHDEIGILDLFIVPVGLDGHGLHYQAVFNRDQTAVSRE